MEPTRTDALLALGERVLDDSSHRFEDHDNRQEAEELLAHVLELDPDDLDDGFVPPRPKRDRYLALIARRAGGEPFPLLVGYIEFWGLDLKVKPGMFMPRPSSELTVERALKRLRKRRNPIVVDLATGTGPIALAIADELEEARVFGTDIAGDMLRLGRQNARDLDIPNVEFRTGDMYGALPKELMGKIDLITGHIPYVPPDEVDDLPSEVKDFEPVSTISDASPDGLTLIRHAVGHGPAWLKPGGWMLLELSEDLGAKVRRMCRRAGLEDHGIATDEDRLSIVVEARQPPGAPGGRPEPPRRPARALR